MGLKTFKKGAHPSEHKESTEHKCLEKMPIPQEVFIPLSQHIGAPCKAIVKKKDEVKAGQIIGESAGFISSTVHATISGTVKTVDSFLHPNGANCQMVHIVGDGNDEWIEQKNTGIDWEKLSNEIIVEKVGNAGIVGMGGAAFPTQVKLNPPKDKPIDTFIINGCECEPYLTADHRMMVEQADDIVLGMRIIMKVLNVKNALIGIEDNKPDAVKVMSKAVSSFDNISVIPLKVKYPQGAEKMLIKAVTDREVPTGGLPMDVGAVVNNVGTAIAIADAVIRNKPLTERVVTVTGDGINEPKNLIARIGTPFKDLLDYCGGLKENTTKLIMGGPMMGITQQTADVPIVKATSGILCLSDKSVLETEEFPCILCGTCVNTCPMYLVPTRISKAVQQEFNDMAEELGIMNCIECGSCSYICPSNIPIVHQIRIGKLKINQSKK